jgi:predicted peroxiredoxin
MLFDGLLARTDFIPAMIAAAMGGLEAKIYFFTKGGVLDKPDHRTRIQALTMLLANAEGEPIKRVIHQHLGTGGSLDLVGAIHDSPALEEAMRHALDKAAFRRRNVKKVATEKPVETEPKT